MIRGFTFSSPRGGWEGAPIGRGAEANANAQADLKFGDKCYFNPGRWSLASDQKTLGGFDLSLSSWDFAMEGKDRIKLYLQGKVSLVSGIDISATCGVDIYAKVKNLTDIKNLKLEYDETKFSDLSLDLTFADMGVRGTLKCADRENTEGYEGSLTFKMPGDLFSAEANGGYFKTENTKEGKYTYGWFYVKAGSNVGIPAPPISINSITAGFYFNCSRNGESANPKRGLIGVIAGLKISTSAGEEALNADVEMTVVYDTGRKRLSTFIFNGSVNALSGLVSAKANLIYENNSTTKYLQVDASLDAKADGEELVGKVAGMSSSVNEIKKALNPDFSGIQKLEPTGSLKGMEDNEKGNPDASKAPDKGKQIGASAGAEISIQVKITWKENGKKLSKAKWHVWLGQPDEDQRCEYTWIKFKSPIVSAELTAKGYVCIGNELPDNGRLPDIPSDISQFLNGSNNGSGIESASLSEANNARRKSLDEFNKQIANNDGGVMFGANIYGYLNMNLGLLELNAGATAGFDISLVHYKGGGPSCVNLNSKAGYKGWYGSGQLYAYLHADMTFHIDLGFWEFRKSLFDAGIGGLFRMQGPRPSHFEGKARVKLKLLGGLVNVDRRFAFECGQDCDAFYGNALDEFKLFGDLSCGYTDKKQGWSEGNAVSPKFLQRPYFTTEVPLNEPFRVLDETEKERLKKDFNGSNTDVLDMEASRTFIFRSNVNYKVTLLEFKFTTSALLRQRRCQTVRKISTNSLP